jgi:putative tryptophan/tyrosine transport system substrate-binding protein
MRSSVTKRRGFIALVCGSAAAWPFRPSAQQVERVRVIGVLTNLAPGDLEGQTRFAAFRQGLQTLGWIDGRNVRIEYRWAGGDADRLRTYAAELVALAPEVILAVSALPVAALQQTTRTVPIVFATVADPVGTGLVGSLARPGGNITGFTIFEFGISAKWLELLKEIAPGVTRAAVLYDPKTVSGNRQLDIIQSAASSLGVELSPVTVGDAGEIERAITAFARSPNGGLILTANTPANVHRQTIITLADRYRLPAVYPAPFYVTGGGLMSYGPDRVDQYRLAAGYVDRILKGEKPSDLPVQSPTKHELIINLKTARALGLEVPPFLLARADEVIE